VKSIARFVLALFMISAGVLHFATPAFFVSIVPAWLPAPMLLVQISGVAEIAGGLGVLLPPTRKLAGVGLVALFVAVFPANVNQALHHIPMNGHPVAPALLWGRLLLQPLLIAWAWWCTRPSAA
jgi:uncharacterized membrane protein